MNRTLKESEELIKKLQTKCWEQEKLIRKMRMSLYYVNKYLDEVACEIDGMWYHGLDGSDLIVSKDELWEVLQHKVLGLIKHGRKVVNEPLAELKKFIGW